MKKVLILKTPKPSGVISFWPFNILPIVLGCRLEKIRKGEGSPVKFVWGQGWGAVSSAPCFSHLPTVAAALYCTKFFSNLPKSLCHLFDIKLWLPWWRGDSWVIADLLKTAPSVIKPWKYEGDHAGRVQTAVTTSSCQGIKREPYFLLTRPQKPDGRRTGPLGLSSSLNKPEKRGVINSWVTTRAIAGRALCLLW